MYISHIFHSQQGQKTKNVAAAYAEDLGDAYIRLSIAHGVDHLLQTHEARGIGLKHQNACATTCSPLALCPS